MVPYTDSIGAHVRELSAGHARVTMADRRRVRNHLRSVHAIALANLGEVATGLAMITAAPQDVRSILVALSVTYLRKARGRLQAECRCEMVLVTETLEQDVAADITNPAGEVVARVVARWRLSPPQIRTAHSQNGAR